LRETIEIIQPRYIVTLGGVALKSLHIIEPHTIHLSSDVGCRIAWFNRWLVPLYHPGARARIHRSINMQNEDFLKLATFLTE
jgi:uracil-DNA glycosylase